jgi:hypothetical protein
MATPKNPGHKHATKNRCIYTANDITCKETTCKTSTLQHPFILQLLQDSQDVAEGPTRIQDRLIK